jgi:type II secretory pathway pseudopilin PulG
MATTRAYPGSGGFTLAEVCISMSLVGLIFGGVIFGYIALTDRAEWSAYSLAAQSLALQGLEQARAAKWDPLAYPPVDELGTTTLVQTLEMDLPVAGAPILATNIVEITVSATAPPLRQIRSCCLWQLPSRGARIGGPFTNTVFTLRAPDQ